MPGREAPVKTILLMQPSPHTIEILRGTISLQAECADRREETQE